MAFKHIRHAFTGTSTVSLLTVPAGKEFVLLKKRARGLHSSGTATVVFKDNGGTAIESLSVSSGDVVVGSSEKKLFSAGESVKGSTTIANAVAEIMGLEYVAGTWESIGGGDSSGSGGGSGGGNVQSGYYMRTVSGNPDENWLGYYEPNGTSSSYGNAQFPQYENANGYLLWHDGDGCQLKNISSNSTVAYGYGNPSPGTGMYSSDNDKMAFYYRTASTGAVLFRITGGFITITLNGVQKSNSVSCIFDQIQPGTYNITYSSTPSNNAPTQVTVTADSFECIDVTVPVPYND